METKTKFIAITLPENYPLVMLMAGLLAMECLVLGFMVPGRARKKVYKDPLVENRIEELHAKQMGRALHNVRGGHPDSGNGRFSTRRMISYAQWLQINTAQRGHKNFLEQLTPICVMTLACGLHLPLVACLVAGLFGVLRLGYFCKNRFIGFIPGSVCLAIQTLGALYSCGLLISDVLSFANAENEALAALNSPVTNNSSLQ